MQSRAKEDNVRGHARDRGDDRPVSESVSRRSDAALTATTKRPPKVQTSSLWRSHCLSQDSEGNGLVWPEADRVGERSRHQIKEAKGEFGLKEQLLRFVGGLWSLNHKLRWN